MEGITLVIALNLSSNFITIGWHHAWNGLLERQPRLSRLVRRMLKEYRRWESRVEEFENAPANGIRGKGSTRRSVYLTQDRNLLTLFEGFQQQLHDPLRYLRAISYHLGMP